MRIVIGMVMLLSVLAGAAFWAQEGQNFNQTERVWQTDGPNPPPTPPPMR